VTHFAEKLYKMFSIGSLFITHSKTWYMYMLDLHLYVRQQTALHHLYVLFFALSSSMSSPNTSFLWSGKFLTTIQIIKFFPKKNSLMYVLFFTFFMIFSLHINMILYVNEVRVLCWSFG